MEDDYTGGDICIDGSTDCIGNNIVYGSRTDIPLKRKAPIKREQSQACLSYVEREGVRQSQSLDRVVGALILRMNVCLEITHNFFKVALCSTATIFLSSVPRTYSMFYIVLWIVVRLNEQKHLF